MTLLHGHFNRFPKLILGQGIAHRRIDEGLYGFCFSTLQLCTLSGRFVLILRLNFCLHFNLMSLLQLERLSGSLGLQSLGKTGAFLILLLAARLGYSVNFFPEILLDSLCLTCRRMLKGALKLSLLLLFNALCLYLELS